MSHPAVADTALSPRSALRDVQHSLADATRAQAAATDAATRAQAFVDEAAASLAKFDRTDETGGEHLARAISSWTSGGPRPSTQPPPDVAALRLGRIAATDDLATARAAFAALVAKAADAAAKVKALEVHRDNLRVLILRQEETALVARVGAADKACQDARDQLEAFLGVHIGASLFPASPDAVSLFATWPSTPQRAINGKALEPLAQPFAALFAKLATDADADAELEAPFIAPPTPDPVTATLRDRAKRMLGA